MAPKKKTREERAAELAAQAKDVAFAQAKKYGVKPEKVRRVIDTVYTHNPVCWVVTENEATAVVVYEESPGSLNTVAMRPHRFKEAA